MSALPGSLNPITLDERAVDAAAEVIHLEDANAMARRVIEAYLAIVRQYDNRPASPVGDSLVDKLEKKKYTEADGMDNEMKNYNSGLDVAIAIAKQHQPEQPSLRPILQRALAAYDALYAPAMAAGSAAVVREADWVTEARAVLGQPMGWEAAARDPRTELGGEFLAMAQEAVVERIYADDNFIDAAVKYKFEGGALMSVVQAAIAAYEVDETANGIYLLPVSGQRAIIDIEDKEKVLQYSWHLDSHGYPRRSVTNANHVYLHTEILGNIPDGLMPDHKNRNPLDNRSRNLRIITRGQNVANTPKMEGNYTSYYKGVSWDKERNKWIASICYNGKRINLGRFDDEEDAARAYNAAAYRFFGDAAFLNTVPDGIAGGLDASTRKDADCVGAIDLSASGVFPTSPTKPASGEAEVKAITSSIDKELRDAGLPKAAGESGIYSDFIVRRTFAYLQQRGYSVESPPLTEDNILNMIHRMAGKNPDQQREHSKEKLSPDNPCEDHGPVGFHSTCKACGTPGFILRDLPHSATPFVSLASMIPDGAVGTYRMLEPKEPACSQYPATPFDPNRHCDAERVIAWIDSPERKPATIAFTEGLERQIAYRFEAVSGGAGVRSGEMRLLTIPTEAMCHEARGFLLGLDSGIHTWEAMRKHLDRGGLSNLPFVIEKAASDPLGHITKWDAADCIWQLMARAHPVPTPLPEPVMSKPVLTAAMKYDIADCIVTESRSKSDIVQDVWDEIMGRLYAD